MVLDLIKPDMESITIKNKAVTLEQKFLTVLRFYASGSFLINVGDQSGIHYSTTSKIVKQVFESIAMLCPEIVHMPSTAEDIRKLSRVFKKLLSSRIV